MSDPTVYCLWNHAPHNAFTDLIHHDGLFHCVLREASAHVSDDGAIRVLWSDDARHWTSATLIESRQYDLRDPHLSATPDGRLMLTAAGARSRPRLAVQSLAWFSRDGSRWAGPHEIGEPDYWLWRTVWHEGQAYNPGYSCRDIQTGNHVRLYTSPDGKQFDILAETMFQQGYANESDLCFLPDGRCLCLLRADRDPALAHLGVARPPYSDWAWRDLDRRLGGPAMLRLPDGRIVVGGRVHDEDGATRTALMWLNVGEATLEEFQALPSGGDCSYPGLVWHDERLWVSYYSSHESRTSVYMAEVDVPEPPKEPEPEPKKKGKPSEPDGKPRFFGRL